MWWDYGNWLSDIGNVTSLADNTTTNSTQIENVGFALMGNENQTLHMLSTYGQNRVKYIAVFTTLAVSQSSSGTCSAIVYPYGYGDEGKWVWMARISGQGMDRLVRDGFISASDAWTNETSFGASGQNGQWQWNNRGLNCTVEELLNYAQVQYAQRTSATLGTQIQADHTATAPTYFKEAYFSGIDVAPNTYGGIVPIVAIYSIDWAAYDAANGITPPSS
jgi:asparagine N-glycosylation enzyme membrane subunit Stt3